MKKLRSLFSFFQKPQFILILILAVFLFKGVFLATVYPIFTGQDEARHYNNIQYISSPHVQAFQKIKRQVKGKKKILTAITFLKKLSKPEKLLV